MLCLILSDNVYFFIPNIVQSTLFSEQHPLFDARDNNKSNQTYFYKSSVRFTTASAFPFSCPFYPNRLVHITQSGWLGWAMVLGSFQCRGVLLLLHIVGQGPAVLAAGVGRVGYIFYNFHLSSISNVLSFGRRLNVTEIL